MPLPTHTEEESSMTESKQADEVRTVEGLMPCPFCGGAATFWGETPTCSRCDAMGPCRDEDVTREQNIAAWNRRATQAQQGEPVMWQHRWLNPAGEPCNPPTRLEWKPVEHPHWQPLEMKLQELRDYRYNGKPCYEVRPLYATPSAPARQAVRMLTDAEVWAVWETERAPGPVVMAKAIQRKFCEVNGIAVEQQEGGEVMADTEAAYKHDRAYTDGMVFARQCIGAPTTMERADEALRKLDTVIQRRHKQERDYRTERRNAGGHPTTATPSAPARQAVRMLTDAARDVLAERQRQVSAEGWTPEHDDEHDRGELARAAGCYAIVAGSCQGWSADTYSGVQAPSSVEDDHDEEATTFWPWDKEWWKPKNPRRDLVRAAALILAEIERLDRAALPLEQQEGGK